MSSSFNSDDVNLIEKFVQGSNQLLANGQVRMETSGNTSQIVARTGEVLAVMHFQTQPRMAIIKDNSPYADLLAEHLSLQDFVLIGSSKRPGYSEYSQYVVPAGYKTYYTEPALLWKKWWPTERFKNKQRFNMNILVRMKENWYPVQNIVVEAGTFSIKTLAGQIEVRGSEQVLWLSQLPQDEKKSDPGKNDVWGSAPDVQKISTPQESAQTPAPEITPPPPPAFQKKLQELEMRLYKQQQATIAAEQRAIRAEQRAAAAEQQLALFQAQAPENELETNWIH